MVKILLILVIIISYCVPSQVSAHSQTQVIEMTPNGFEPNQVEVDTNSTLIFINKDSKARWPASNIHPTHELYSEFDPRRPIAAGESWTFKPKKAGEWKYHDHLLPHQRGSLTVISEGQVAGVKGEQVKNKGGSNIIDRVKSFLDEIMIKIKNIFRITKKDKQVLGIGNFTNLATDAQIKALKEMAEKEEVEKVWQFVKATFVGQAGSSGNIHDLAHLAGALIYEKKGFSGVGFCSSQFAFGCFHGFLDKAFAKNLDQLADAHDACLKLGSDGSGPVASCIHGIGHGVASYFSTSDIKKSLTPCRKLTSGQEYCFDGVFMEYVRSAPETAFKKADPLYPCNSLEKEFGYTYSFSCGRNQPSMLMSRFKMGFDEVVGICLNATSTPFKQACFDSLGFSLASQGQASQIIEGCQKIGIAEFIARCTKAAAGELVFQEVPNWQEKSEAVCNSALVGRDECLSHLDRLILEYNRQKKISFTPIKNNEDLNLYLRREIKKCYDTGGAGGCYKDVAELFYDQLGLAKTLELLKANENSPEVYARCHEVTHYLSRSEYQKQKSIAKVYAQCDSTCHGGCYHGTLEAYLKQQEGKAGFNLTSHFPQVCGKVEDYQKPLEFNECLHGMGHAAMFITDMELRESLTLCDTIEDGEQRDRCFTGVFMENSSSSTSFDHQSRYIKTDDPYFPCNSLDERYQAVCWQYQSSYFSIINNQDWVKVSDMCLQIPIQYQDKCFRTIGTNQVGFTPSLWVMKQDCNLMPSEHFKDVCVGGVVSSLSYRFVGDISRIVEFCSLVDSPNQETCYKQMGNGIADWVADKNMVKVECGKIPDLRGQNWCAGVI